MESHLLINVMQKKFGKFTSVKCVAFNYKTFFCWHYYFITNFKYTSQIYSYIHQYFIIVYWPANTTWFILPICLTRTNYHKSYVKCFDGKSRHMISIRTWKDVIVPFFMKKLTKGRRALLVMVIWLPTSYLFST